MINGQWRLVYPGTEYTFGTPATPVFNLTTPDIGDVDIQVDDKENPREDGRSFGVDFFGGRTISFDLGVRSRSELEARDESATFLRVWRADAVRTKPGAVAALHSQYAGRERVVYGRPRRKAPNYNEVTVNTFATIVADFVCVDDRFYGADEEIITFGSTTAGGGGLLAPLAAPLSTTESSDRSQVIRVDSELPVCPVIELKGPITNALITIPGVLELDIRLALAYDDTVVIDTRPWSRSALRNGSANVAGAVRGTRLSKAVIPPGAHEVSLRGLDPTGTASVRLSWQPAFSTL